MPPPEAISRPEAPDPVNVARAATLLRLSTRRIRQLCEQRKMGTKIGRDWWITLAEIEANRYRRKGRPPFRLGKPRGRKLHG